MGMLKALLGVGVVFGAIWAVLTWTGYSSCESHVARLERDADATAADIAFVAELCAAEASRAAAN